MQQIKEYLDKHEKQYELFRYLIAGGLTTLLSMVIHYGLCLMMATKPENTANVIEWVIVGINNATSLQLSIASSISWVIAVLFAFWINRVMVFQVASSEKKQVLTELTQFAGSRLISFFLFEQGMMLLMSALGVSNIVNRIVVLVFVMVFNYVVSKFWIFKK